MPRKLIRILALNPGTRYLGIAIFEGAELLDWGVKVIKGRWSNKKMEKVKKIVLDFIERYGPNVLAIKKLHPSRSSPSLGRLASAVKVLLKRRGLKVYQYSVKDLESFFSPEEKVNRKGMAELVASMHPELRPELEKEKSHKNPYHLRMFEAVALGAMCFHQLDK